MRELAHAGDTATVVHGVSFSKALHYHFVKFYWDIGGLESKIRQKAQDKKNFKDKAAFDRFCSSKNNILFLMKKIKIYANSY